MNKIKLQVKDGKIKLILGDSEMELNKEQLCSLEIEVFAAWVELSLPVRENENRSRLHQEA